MHVLVSCYSVKSINSLVNVLDHQEPIKVGCRRHLYWLSSRWAESCNQWL